MASIRSAHYVFETAALVSGLVAGTVSYILKEDLQLSLMLGLVVTVGLLVVKVIAELAEISQGINHANRSLKEMHSSLLERDHHLAALQHLNVDDSGSMLAVSVRRLNAALAQVPPALFGVVAELLNDPVEALERGHIVTPISSSSLGSHLVRNFEESVFTTSFHPLDFWLTNYGRNYNEAIRDRIRELTTAGRSVRFRRVFIVKDALADDLRSGPYREVINEQLTTGIDVRVVPESTLASELRIDFGLWDGQLEVELETDQNRRVVAWHYRFSRDALIVAERRLERIWDRSMPFSAWLKESRA